MTISVSFIGRRGRTSKNAKSGGDEEVKTSVRDWLHQRPTYFYESGIHAFIRRRGYYVEKWGFEPVMCSLYMFDCVPCFLCSGIGCITF